MSTLKLVNACIVDGTAADRGAPVQVFVENGIIREVAETVGAGAEMEVDLGRRTLMPGLIDAHVHVIACLANLGLNARLPDSLVAARAMHIMKAMLMRGFTTVRDAGGADAGLRQAVEEGLFLAPRLLISGKALSQTGGHADYRGPWDDVPAAQTRHRLGALGRIVDGVPDLRRATREEIKSGIDFVKIMANGGAASPTDPIHFLGFSREELLAVVEEAEMAGLYVAAHVYTDASIRRVVDAGVRSLEHCNFISAETASLAAAKGCIAVPTLVTFNMLVSEGPSLGFPPDSVAKAESVRQGGMASLETMRQAGLEMAYGTDLLGDMQRHQSEEFVIRGEVLPAQTVIASATRVAAKLLRREGQIGCIAPGACADMIVVDGDPLGDLSLLTGQGRHMPAILKAGDFVKNEL